MSLQILSRKRGIFFFSVGDRVGPRVDMPIESACVSVRRVKVKRGGNFLIKSRHVNWHLQIGHFCESHLLIIRVANLQKKL